MELLKFVLLVVFMLSACQAAALPSCIWNQYRLKLLNEKSIGLLESMGGRMPLECLEEKNNNSFPTHVFTESQSEDLFLVALKTLKGVVRIFQNNHTAVTWNTKQLRYFESNNKRQVENLQKCVGEQAQAVTHSTTDTLGSYFKNLEERLKHKEFSSCAWEMVRTELQDGLEKFQVFIESKK